MNLAGLPALGPDGLGGGTPGNAYTFSPPLTVPTTPAEESGVRRNKRRRNTANPNDCCRTCRLRKVKCTGNPGFGPCINCARLELACGFLQDTSSVENRGKICRTMPSRDLTEAGTLRKRAQRACSQCHAHKTKCSGDLPRCKRCESADTFCEYNASKRKFFNMSIPPGDEIGQHDGVVPIIMKEESAGARSLSETQTSAVPGLTEPVQTSLLTAESFLMNRGIVLTHIDAYFQHYFPIPCYGFLHPPTIYAALDDGELSSVVTAGICCLTSRLVSQGHASDSGSMLSSWSDQVDFHIFRHVDSFLHDDTRENLVVLVLATLHNLVSGQWNKVWMYLAMAARVITALQLNWDAGGSFVKQEASRRLVWMVWVLDRFLAGGFDDHLVLRDDVMYLRFPCSNDSFREGKPTVSEAVPRRPLAAKRAQETSMYGCHIRLHRLRHRILGMAKRFGPPRTQHPRHSRVEPSRVADSVSGLQAQLDRFGEALPEPFRFGDANLRRMLASAERQGYAMLHTWHWQLHVDLYRFALPGLGEAGEGPPPRPAEDPALAAQLPPAFLRRARGQAAAHAVSLARLWQLLRRDAAGGSGGGGGGTGSPGAERTIVTVDPTLAACVICSTEVLLAARRHRLGASLGSHGAAPLCRGPVDDGTLVALMQSNVEVLASLAGVIPRIADIARDLRAAVDAAQAEVELGRPVMTGLPVGPHLDLGRLPRSFDILEGYYARDQADVLPGPERSASLPEPWAGDAAQRPAPPPPPPRRRGGAEAQGSERPGIPFHLADGRGFAFDLQAAARTEERRPPSVFVQSPPLLLHSPAGRAGAGLDVAAAFPRQQGLGGLGAAVGLQDIAGVQQHAGFGLGPPEEGFLGSPPYPPAHIADSSTFGLPPLFRPVSYG